MEWSSNYQEYEDSIGRNISIFNNNVCHGDMGWLKIEAFENVMWEAYATSTVNWKKNRWIDSKGGKSRRKAFNNIPHKDFRIIWTYPEKSIGTKTSQRQITKEMDRQGKKYCSHPFTKSTKRKQRSWDVKTFVWNHNRGITISQTLECD